MGYDKRLVSPSYRGTVTFFNKKDETTNMVKLKKYKEWGKKLVVDK